MHIIQLINTRLVQIANALQVLSAGQYSEPIPVLSNASIGQHIRHIIEFFKCLEEGYYTGQIDYENRKRDKEIEINKLVALEWLENIKTGLQKENKELMLNVKDAQSSDSHFNIPTNYYRELLYNLEHMIHHMALLRIGITETTQIELANEFGIAPATLKYKRACAQSASYH